MTDSATKTTSPFTQIHAEVKPYPLTTISPDPEQDRSQVNTANDDWEALLSSIRENGVLDPIILRSPYPDENLPPAVQYVIVSGERRFRASQEVGLTTIPAFKPLPGDEAIVLKAMWAGNLREDLSLPDKLRAFARRWKFLNAQHEAGQGDKPTYDILAKDGFATSRTIQDMVRVLEVLDKAQDLTGAPADLGAYQRFEAAFNFKGPDWICLFTSLRAAAGAANLLLKKKTREATDLHLAAVMKRYATLKKQGDRPEVLSTCRIALSEVNDLKARLTTPPSTEPKTEPDSSTQPPTEEGAAAAAAAQGDPSPSPPDGPADPSTAGAETALPYAKPAAILSFNAFEELLKKLGIDKVRRSESGRKQAQDQLRQLLELPDLSLTYDI